VDDRALMSDVLDSAEWVDR